jgi:serine/threonine protein kinase
MSTDSSIAHSGLPSPPPDTPPKKFQTPYIIGAKFVAKRHEPPTRVEMGYHEYSRLEPEVTGDLSHMDWVLSHPPAPGVTHTMDERCIEIAAPVRDGASCGAQVVVTAEGLIAKIFDPLYYKYHNTGCSYQTKFNVTDSVDHDYITEAAAYSELIDSTFQGTIMPKYYGSWTLSLPIPVDGYGESREVRLILLEHVPGISMHKVDPETLTRKERNNIMIKLLEADVDLRCSGLRHDDLEPRNVMLSLPDSSTSYEDGDFRLCIIDFAICGLSKDDGRKGPVPEVRNPLFYWTGQDCFSQWGWLPSQAEALEWMWEIWGNGGKDGKYVVVERDPDSYCGEPKSPRYMQ